MGNLGGCGVSGLESHVLKTVTETTRAWNSGLAVAILTVPGKFTCAKFPGRFSGTEIGMTTTLSDAALERDVQESGAFGERRARARFRLACPVRLSRGGLERFSSHWTEDVSCEGFSCFSEVGFSAGEVLDCELTVSDGRWSDSLGDLVLCCQVEVRRSIRRIGDGGFTLGCRLLDYTAEEHWNFGPA